MNRRSLLQSLVACVAASAIEVCGWKAPRNLNQFFPETSAKQWEKYRYAPPATEGSKILYGEYVMGFDPAFPNGDHSTMIVGRVRDDGSIEILKTMRYWEWTTDPLVKKLYEALPT